jgi:methylenetetrahydrofolate dehydrogenase (NADP+)/methenyltetrahydrofolate cyclohydrolase
MEKTKTKMLFGQPVADALLESVRADILKYADKAGRKPGLGVVLVGDNPASQSYIKMKEKKCHEIGIQSYEHRLRADEGEARLAEVLKQLNAEPKVDGILLQLPLPKNYHEDKMLELISPDKDVDGLHACNIGKLLLGRATFRSCTPAGVMEILHFYGISPSGKHVVIVGRSNIVGKPLGAMLVQKDPHANATVTWCHSGTQNLETITRQADILVAALGQPLAIKRQMVREGAVVIDVGINRVSDSTSPKGFRIVGDVDFDEVAKVSSAITPVPGGVGPMTIAMLMKNTVQAFRQHNHF